MARDLETAVHEALKIPRRLRLTVWDQALQEHRHHPTFQTQTHPYTLEYGFTCQCSGVEEEWRIFIGELKQLVPGAMASVCRIFGFGPKAGDKLRKRQAVRAHARARALLHRHLTREQRFELKRTRGFRMKDRAGRLYHVTEGTSTNIYIEHEGTKYALCVIPTEKLPLPDVLLAQKIMLETDPEAFIRLARVRNTETGEMYESGAFLLGEEPRPVPWNRLRNLAELTPEQIENPQEWVEERLGVTRGAIDQEFTDATEEVVERVETRDV